MKSSVFTYCTNSEENLLWRFSIFLVLRETVSGNYKEIIDLWRDRYGF